jgi:hypothetical protein
MRLVQLSPLSIESLMTKPKSLSISLDDLLTAVPMNWRDRPSASSPNPHSKNVNLLRYKLLKQPDGCLGFSSTGDAGSGRIMQSPKSQVSPVPFRFERELPKLPSEKSAKIATNRPKKRTLSTSTGIWNLAKLRGNSLDITCFHRTSC